MDEPELMAPTAEECEEAAKPNLVDDGWYRVQNADSESMLSGKGKDMIRLQVNVLDNSEAQTIYHYLTFPTPSEWQLFRASEYKDKPKGWWFTKTALSQMGYFWEGNLPPVEEIAASLMGMDYEVYVVKVDEDEEGNPEQNQLKFGKKKRD